MVQEFSQGNATKLCHVRVLTVYLLSFLLAYDISLCHFPTKHAFYGTIFERKTSNGTNVFRKPNTNVQEQIFLLSYLGIFAIWVVLNYTHLTVLTDFYCKLA